MMRASSSGAAAFSIARVACLSSRLSEALAGIIVDAIGRKPDKHDFPIFGEDDLARLRKPIGLPIGARAPWEIGVATLTEVVAKTRETLPKSQRSGS